MSGHFIGSVLLMLMMTVGAHARPWVETLHRAPELRQSPDWRAIEGFKTADPAIRAIFYDVKPPGAKATRVFAFLGIPPHEPGQKLPGIVLIHGGGGTAYQAWVKAWNDRGYVAISIDYTGGRPSDTTDAEGAPRTRDELSGPDNLEMMQVDWPMVDQWQYHAVADVMAAHSLLLALPEVDPQRTALTGLSWGGYLTCLVAGVDERFKAAIPVYGCGFVHECVWAPVFEKMEPEKAAKWTGLWDPQHLLPRAKMPMYWISGTNDGAYYMPAWQKSYRLAQGPRTLSLLPGLPHSNVEGRVPHLIAPYLDHLFKGTPALPAITGQGRQKNHVWVTYTATMPITQAMLLFTRDQGPWQHRKWKSVPAQIGKEKIIATLPDDAKAYFINITDQRQVFVSSEHQER